MKRFVVLFVLVAILSACNSTKKESKENTAAQDTQIEVLEAEVKSLSSQISALQNRLDIVQPLSVTFTPSSTGYSTVQSPMGNFIVLLENLKKYANGYKATFLIGNPNYMTFSGLKLFLRWGKPYSGNGSYSDWYKTLQAQEIDINKSMLPGIWNRVTVVLSPATSTEVGTIILSISPDEVLLAPDSRRGVN